MYDLESSSYLEITQRSQVEKPNMSEILFVSCPKNCLAFLTPSDSLENRALSVPISSSKTNYLAFYSFTNVLRMSGIFLFACVRVGNG